jgi:methylamine---glutamate N-methyltransferase subunit B
LGEGMKTFDCSGRSIREINTFLKGISRPDVETEAVLLNPDSRHNIAVGLNAPLTLRIEGHVGYYCAGLCERINVDVAGNAGWGFAENLMSGTIRLAGNAGSAAGATMRGGTVVIKGNAGARCGVAMKGGTLVVGGSVGYMSGFMMQKGAIVVCGDAGEGLGDSLYEGVIYLRGKAESYGSDAIESEMTNDDIQRLARALAVSDIDASAADFKKIASGRRLYNFDKKEKEIWRTAL